MAHLKNHVIVTKEFWGFSDILQKMTLKFCSEFQDIREDFDRFDDAIQNKESLYALIRY